MCEGLGAFVGCVGELAAAVGKSRVSFSRGPQIKANKGSSSSRHEPRSQVDWKGEEGNEGRG